MNTAMRSLFATTISFTALIGPIVAHAQSLSSVTGGYFFPNPGASGGRNGNAGFDAAFAQFNTFMGTPQHFRDMFGDFYPDIAGSQYWNVNACLYDQYCSPSSGLTPIIELAMAQNSSHSPAATTADFITIASGAWDSEWTGAVDVWANAGYKNLMFRIGGEMNGNWFQWSVSDAPSWNLAFQHVATTLRAEAAKMGVTVQIVWNPCVVIGNSAGIKTSDMYPGDAYVDIMGLDIYSSTNYNPTFINWGPGNVVKGYAPTLDAWNNVAINRQHFWSYPDAIDTDVTGTHQLGWGMWKHKNFAKAHGKPIMIAETGVGASPGPAETLIDDAVFPHWLAQQLSAYPLGVSAVVIWAEDDGGSGFRGNFLPGGDPLPLSGAAWRKYFGNGS